MSSKPLVIGICGGSGSGKTTLLRRVAETFNFRSPSIFSMDNYYYPIENQQKDNNGIVNFDLPTALDEASLTKDLEKLVNGQAISVKEYFFNSPPDKHVVLTIQPSKFIIVEGLFLFHYKKVQELLDFKIFVDVNQKTQLDRRIYRDQETRGYNREDIIYQWTNHVLPCYEKFIQPYKERADYIFYNDERCEVDYLKLKQKIEKLFE